MAEGRQPLINFKYNRRLRRFKQKDIAWILEVHPTKISKLEKCAIEPDYKMLDRISILLEVSKDELNEDAHIDNIRYVMERLKLFREMKDEKSEENNQKESEERG